MVRGALRALGLALKDSRLGLIGCGNIGYHLLSRFMAEGAECVVVEGNPSRVAELKALGVKVYSPEEKAQFLAEPIDALSLNANGGSLDMTSIDLICKNPRLKFVGGCENLVMPDPHGATVLKEAQKIYCHTELCGMMGYLTAVEEYLSKREGVTYDMKSMFKAAEKLEEAGFKATQHLIEKSYTLSFEDAMRAVYKAS
jgi:glutamate dehydrogenase/leucine dehydrogenase